jgi:competence protein ComEC
MRLPIYFFLIVITALCIREIALLPDGKLHVHMLDVDQGDSYLVVTPSGKQIVLDGGPNLRTLEHLGNYMPFFDRNIEMIIMTHPDADHITALPHILRRYTVDTIVLSGALHNSGRYREVLHAIPDTVRRVILADPSKDILFDGITLDTVWPRKDVLGTTPRSQNNQSVVVRMLYGEHSILFTGDIERAAEDAILASGADMQSDVMTVPHHGSRTSSSTGFLLAVSPHTALLSAGKDNTYGHPHEEVVKRYDFFGIPIKTTQEFGTISMEFE